MNKPESVDEWRAKAERLIDDYASTKGLVGLNKKWADIQAHLAAHPSNQVQEPVAWMKYHSDGTRSVTAFRENMEAWAERGVTLTPLYASPQAVPSEQPIAEQPQAEQPDSVYLGSAGPSEDLQTALPEGTRDASGVPRGEWGGLSPKQAWWAGYRVGKGLPPDMPRSEAVRAPTNHLGE